MFQGGAAFVDRFSNLYLMSWMFVFLMLSSDINVKTWPLPRTMGSMCAGGGGGGQSRRYNQQTPIHDPSIGYSIS